MDGFAMSLEAFHSFRIGARPGGTNWKVLGCLDSWRLLARTDPMRPQYSVRAYLQAFVSEDDAGGFYRSRI
jgi:hypothetical protein